MSLMVGNGTGVPNAPPFVGSFGGSGPPHGTNKPPALVASSGMMRGPSTDRPMMMQGALARAAAAAADPKAEQRFEGR